LTGDLTQSIGFIETAILQGISCNQPHTIQLAILKQETIGFTSFEVNQVKTSSG
jgi:hypothetical protein